MKLEERRAPRTLTLHTSDVSVMESHRQAMGHVLIDTHRFIHLMLTPGWVTRSHVGVRCRLRSPEAVDPRRANIAQLFRGMIVGAPIRLHSIWTWTLNASGNLQEPRHRGRRSGRSLVASTLPQNIVGTASPSLMPPESTQHAGTLSRRSYAANTFVRRPNIPNQRKPVLWQRPSCQFDSSHDRCGISNSKS